MTNEEKEEIKIQIENWKSFARQKMEMAESNILILSRLKDVYYSQAINYLNKASILSDRLKNE